MSRAMLVRLEPLSVEHLGGVMTWVNDRDVMQYFANRQTPIVEDEERAYLEALVRSPNDRAWSIYFGQDYVGQCSVNQIYWPAKNGRVFIAIARKHQGRGIGPAALAQMIERAWGELDLHKLWLIVRRDNRGAQAMYLKLGFEFEGVLRDEYCVGGAYFDMVRMGLVRAGR
jgi:diamine N-acetyltransferase